MVIIFSYCKENIIFNVLSIIYIRSLRKYKPTLLTLSINLIYLLLNSFNITIRLFSYKSITLE